jgi:hypothetical protein
MVIFHKLWAIGLKTMKMLLKRIGPIFLSGQTNPVVLRSREGY